MIHSLKAETNRLFPQQPSSERSPDADPCLPRAAESLPCLRQGPSFWALEASLFKITARWLDLHSAACCRLPPTFSTRESAQQLWQALS